MRAHRRSAGRQEEVEVDRAKSDATDSVVVLHTGVRERRKEGEGSMTPVLPPSSAKMLEATGSYLTVGVLAAGRACTN